MALPLVLTGAPLIARARGKVSGAINWAAAMGLGAYIVFFGLGFGLVFLPAMLLLILSAALEGPSRPEMGSDAGHNVDIRSGQ